MVLAKPPCGKARTQPSGTILGIYEENTKGGF